MLSLQNIHCITLNHIARTYDGTYDSFVKLKYALEHYAYTNYYNYNVEVLSNNSYTHIKVIIKCNFHDIEQTFELVKERNILGVGYKSSGLICKQCKKICKQYEGLFEKVYGEQIDALLTDKFKASPDYFGLYYSNKTLHKGLMSKYQQHNLAFVGFIDTYESIIYCMCKLCGYFSIKPVKLLMSGENYNCKKCANKPHLRSNVNEVQIKLHKLYCDKVRVMQLCRMHIQYSKDFLAKRKQFLSIREFVDKTGIHYKMLVGVKADSRSVFKKQSNEVNILPLFDLSNSDCSVFIKSALFTPEITFPGNTLDLSYYILSKEKNINLKGKPVIFVISIDIENIKLPYIRNNDIQIIVICTSAEYKKILVNNNQITGLQDNISFIKLKCDDKGHDLARYIVIKKYVAWHYAYSQSIDDFLIIEGDINLVVSANDCAYDWSSLYQYAKQMVTNNGHIVGLIGQEEYKQKTRSGITAIIYYNSSYIFENLFKYAGYNLWELIPVKYYNYAADSAYTLIALEVLYKQNPAYNYENGYIDIDIDIDNIKVFRYRKSALSLDLKGVEEYLTVSRGASDVEDSIIMALQETIIKRYPRCKINIPYLKLFMLQNHIPEENISKLATAIDSYTLNSYVTNNYRDYQKEALKQIESSRENIKRVFLPTGTGKTYVIFYKALNDYIKGKDVIIIEPFLSLVDQMFTFFKREILENIPRPNLDIKYKFPVLKIATSYNRCLTLAYFAQRMREPQHSREKRIYIVSYSSFINLFDSVGSESLNNVSFIFDEAWITAPFELLNKLPNSSDKLLMSGSEFSSNYTYKLDYSNAFKLDVIRRVRSYKIACTIDQIKSKILENKPLKGIIYVSGQRRLEELIRTIPQSFKKANSAKHGLQLLTSYLQECFQNVSINYIYSKKYNKKYIDDTDNLNIYKLENFKNKQDNAVLITYRSLTIGFDDPNLGYIIKLGDLYGSKGEQILGRIMRKFPNNTGGINLYKKAYYTGEFDENLKCLLATSDDEIKTGLYSQKLQTPIFDTYKPSITPTPYSKQQAQTRNLASKTPFLKPQLYLNPNESIRATMSLNSNSRNSGLNSYTPINLPSPNISSKSKGLFGENNSYKGLSFKDSRRSSIDSELRLKNNGIFDGHDDSYKSFKDLRVFNIDAEMSDNLLNPQNRSFSGENNRFYRILGSRKSSIDLHRSPDLLNLNAQNQINNFTTKNPSLSINKPSTVLKLYGKQQASIRAGIVNHRVNCYINASLQLLSCMEPILRQLTDISAINQRASAISQRLSEDGAIQQQYKNYILSTNLFNVINEIMTQLTDGRETPINIGKLLSCFDQSKVKSSALNVPIFKNTQEDAQEFIIKFLNITVLDNPSVIHKRRITCSNCSGESIIDERQTFIGVNCNQPHLVISNAVFTGNNPSIEGLKEENKYQCSSRICGGTKQNAISEEYYDFVNQDYILVHLVLFDNSGNKYDGNIYINDIEIQGLCYKPIACIVHIGQNINEGHYIAVSRNTCQDNFVIYDDKNVSITPNEDINAVIEGSKSGYGNENPQPYIILYKKQTQSPYILANRASFLESQHSNTNEAIRDKINTNTRCLSIGSNSPGKPLSPQNRVFFDEYKNFHNDQSFEYVRHPSVGSDMVNNPLSPKSNDTFFNKFSFARLHDEIYTHNAKNEIQNLIKSHHNSAVIAGGDKIDSYTAEITIRCDNNHETKDYVTNFINSWCQDCEVTDNKNPNKIKKRKASISTSELEKIVNNKTISDTPINIVKQTNFKTSEPIRRSQNLSQQASDNILSQKRNSSKQSFAVERVVNNKNSLDKQEQISTKKQYKCDFPGCNHEAIHSGNLKEHQQIHTGEKPYVCDSEGCNKRFARANILKTHIRTHTGEKPYVCDFKHCDKKFITKGTLNRHKRTHTGEKPYVCDLEDCDKKFITKLELETHKKRHTEEKLYVCDFEDCDKKFFTKLELETHKKRHTGEKLCVCDFEGCDKKFLTKVELETHKKRRHTEEKPYVCDFAGCNKRYAKASDLKRHKKVHESNR
ncbi:C2H2-type zinc finger protein [Allofrancisella frigidaquae]|uniref:Uncharacterized protein n=1 Tax=Allofrancisella frigidaquae TaxID=1085644 RepID=A0A6M3HW41_9GAMM|nr:C2H2-type zinc finger protein [Allofrancisella frigidaquae]QIV94482.1 hypothetical protein E3E15_03545 [Allofrancisella frigidaquae]